MSELMQCETVGKRVCHAGASPRILRSDPGRCPGVKWAFGLTLFISVVSGLAAPALAISNTAYEAGSRIRQQLMNDDKSAADDLLNNASGQGEMIAYFLETWAEPLRKMERYDVLEKLTDVLIHERPFAMPDVLVAQRIRVETELAAKKYPEALVEAKRYYDVCFLSRTDEALTYIAMAIRGVGEPGAEETIAKLLAEQKAATVGERSLAGDLAAKTGGATGVLTTIVTDAKPYETEIAADLGGNPYQVQLGRGNLLLLAGKPGEAKACFVQAAKVQDGSEKALTRAIEGIARSIRAEDGNIARANAFVAELQKKP